MSAVHVRRLTVQHGRTTVLDAVDLDVAPGSWVCLVGPNGAGKTTLLRAVAGARATTGTVLVDDEDVARLPARARARLVGVVPQGPVRPDGMPVLDYVLLGRAAHVPHLGVEGADDVACVRTLLDQLDLRALAGRAVTSLSGGEFQRAVLARALAQEAPVLLLDEPTSSLDIGNGQRVLELVDQLRRDRGLTVVSALHDLTTAGQFADRLVLLRDGRVVAHGAPAEVLRTDTIATGYRADVRVVHDHVAGRVVAPHRVPTHAPDGGGT